MRTDQHQQQIFATNDMQVDAETVVLGLDTCSQIKRVHNCELHIRKSRCHEMKHITTTHKIVRDMTQPTKVAQYLLYKQC